MTGPTRRKILKTGAAATLMAATPRVLAQVGQSGAAGTFYEKGPVRIHYEQFGSGYPAAAHRGRRAELDDRGPDQSFQCDRGVQGRVPLHRVGPQERLCRPVYRPSRDRPALGRVYR